MRYQLWLLVCLVATPAFATGAPAADDRYVVIISIDGFPAWALWDEQVPLPTIRELARAGAHARVMTPSTPSVTWPNHTTLVTGVHPEKHGVLYNGLLVRAGPGEPVRVDPRRDKAELVRVPTLYDLAHTAGLRTAEINWPCTRNAGTLDDSFPDVPDNVTHTTPRLRRELVQLGLLQDETDASLWRYSPVGRDHVWTQAAVHLIRERRPNLLLLHLLNVDGTHHNFGVDTSPGMTALAHADRHVRDVLDALDEAGIRDRTTLFIVSDHGFINTTHSIAPNVLLRQHGLLKTNDEGQITQARVQVVSVGGAAMVFATDPATRERDLREARRILEGAEGIARVLTPVEYSRYGLPLPASNEQVGDLFLAAEDGYGFAYGLTAGGEYVTPRNFGHHGYLADNPRMAALFVASGRGIRAGVELETVDNRSVAPTAARLLGLTLESADGAVLDAVLESNDYGRR
jgi:predicted AlkP superfamily pyrophosphatase or phosphodiesterase